MQEDHSGRLSRLEDEVHDLYKTVTSVKDTISDLNTSIALLNHTIQNMEKGEAKREAFSNRLSAFLVGGFMSAIITFVVKGGLSI